MKARYVTIIFMLLFTVGFLGSCKKDNDIKSKLEAASSSSSSTSGSISGQVLNYSTGAAIPNTTVTIGTVETTSDASGDYSISYTSAEDRVVVNATATNYADQSKIASRANTSENFDILMVPVTHSEQFDPTVAQTISVTGSPAQVELGANALTTQSVFSPNGETLVQGGMSPTGEVTANITVIDPSSNPEIMPGDFTTSTDQWMESFGAMGVTFRDSVGADLDLNSTTSTIRIPVASSTTSPLATIPLFYYDATTGKWVEEGSATLSNDQTYYEGSVSHFSTWNADYAYTSLTITGFVKNSDGNPISGARVTSTGSDYIGTATTYSLSDGSFSVEAKPEATVLINAKNSTGASNTLTKTTGTVGETEALTEDLIIGEQAVTITLSWGENPRDLDSHLTGPQEGSSTRFHVYFSSLGSLTSAPYAALDVDDITSYGPEVITISDLTDGTYRYSVHHFSGTSTISASPARVELNMRGRTYVYSPPAGQTGSDNVWVVFELTVSGSSVTVATVGSWDSSSNSPYANDLFVQPEDKPEIFGDWW